MSNMTIVIYFIINYIRERNQKEWKLITVVSHKDNKREMSTRRQIDPLNNE